VVEGATPAWDRAIVRAWLGSRILAARADQVAAERRGREGQDDCDVAAAEEMICASLNARNNCDGQSAFLGDLKTLLDSDDFAWRGVYNDARFDRHARNYIRKLIRMAKANAGFEKLSRCQ
jgi:hypothetical protein